MFDRREFAKSMDSTKIFFSMSCVKAPHNTGRSNNSLHGVLTAHITGYSMHTAWHTHCTLHGTLTAHLTLYSLHTALHINCTLHDTLHTHCTLHIILTARCNEKIINYTCSLNGRFIRSPVEICLQGKNKKEKYLLKYNILKVKIF